MLFEKKKILIKELKREGFLHSLPMIKAIKKVKRELFMAKGYKQYAYVDEPFPIPPFNNRQTISAPHTYPLLYEALELKKGDSILEVGTGSGYGAVLAKELVGRGKVVTIERDKETYEFARKNIKKTRYNIISILGDGSEGCAKYAPYDKICVTASSHSIPKPLIEQLAVNGKLIIPIGPTFPSQRLVLVEKDSTGKTREKTVDYVVYVPLVGKHGY